MTFKQEKYTSEVFTEKKIENKQVTKTENGKRERKKEIELVFKCCL